MRTSSFLLTLLAAASLPATALAAPKFSSSSSYDTGDSKLDASLAFDGLLATSWAEGKSGDGVGEWIEVDLGEDRPIEVVSVWAGAFGSKEEWSGRGRGAEITISGTGPEGEFSVEAELGDRFARKDVSLRKTVRTLRITLDVVHQGSVFESTHISEVAFDFHDPALSKDVLVEAEEKITKEVARSRTTRELPETEPADLKEAYYDCKDNIDYSKRFKVVGAVAKTGWQWRIPFVQKFVPVGYRLQALQFEEKAVGYLVKLKDPNAIPYFEAAAAGTQSLDDREWLFLEVKFLLAEQDLRRSKRATVPQWGSEGFEQGAFMSRKEALDIEVDSAGNLWATDLGNNRVQRFTSAGTADKVLGGEGGIAEKWFGEKGDPYATASLPGTEAGQFEQPLALTVGNYDILVVIDAALRVQTWDAEGAPKATWTIDKDWKPSSGRGAGTPIITWMGDDFYFIIKDEVLIYTAEGELKSRYTLAGGDVQAAVIAAGGKLLVRHSATTDVIEYKPADGFRQGKFFKKGGVPDDGSEDWDMCTDSDDNLYIATDAGNVHIWNKRSKFIETVRPWERARNMPRCAVNGPIVYVIAGDEIARVQREE
ncbi:MAG: hypothetical protein KDA24_20690 [Deltaproteobacteria bacterium]|nr:hypothetical protein [Deltaproteobacteria bacterium]